MRPLLPLALALFALPLFAGCGGMADSAGPSGCFTSDQCAPLQQCILGECTYDRPAFPTDIWAAPLRASSLLPQPVRGIELTPGGRLEVDVHPPRAMVVASPAPVKALFTAQGETVRPLSFSVEITDIPEAPAGEPALGEAVVGLVDGVVDGKTHTLDPLRYQVTVLPLSAQCCAEGEVCLAPSVATVSEDGQPGYMRLETRNTVVMTGTVLLSLDDPTPAADLQVQAFDASGEVFSLPVRTGADGSFCLAVTSPDPAGTHELTLRLGPDPRWPTAEVAGLSVGTDPVDLGAMHLLGGDPLPTLRPVEGQITNESGAPVQGARVWFKGIIPAAAGVEATFTGSAVTDAAGRWSASIYDGQYTLWVQPGASAAEGRVETLGTVSAQGLEAPGLSPLPFRPIVSGRLLGPSGDPVANARVVATPDATAIPGAGPMEVETLTGATGAWSLRLDPGAWTFRFEPPPEAALPWIVGRAMTVEAGGGTLETPPLATEAPVRLPGVVRGSEELAGLPLADFQVEVYGRTPSGRSVRVAQARSGADGSFEILLPRSLAGEVAGQNR